MDAYDLIIWDYFVERIQNERGVAGLMGNLQAESGLMPNNVQNELGWTDEDYTNAVNNGSYSEHQFVNDSIGYGLAQWTTSDRKQGLYIRFEESIEHDISDIYLQLDYLWYELENKYPGVLEVLKNADSIREASDSVLHDFERPADQSESVEAYRESLGVAIYEKLEGTYDGPSGPRPGDLTALKRRKYNFLLYRRNIQMMRGVRRW